MNPLKELERCGQSPWLDLLQRSLIESGRLREMIERDGLKGLTSNPSIFEKAIGESDEYDEALKQFQSEGDHGVGQIYEHLAIDDIRAAADAFRQVYEQSRGRDGYVSLECSPYLANDAKATVDEALRLWSAVNRPNLMVKVPATPAGLPAIRQLLGQGLNINITLLFSVGVYEQVVEAYLGGLEDFARAGGDLSRVASVASFFVSRIDSAVDRQLEKSADRQAAAPLMGRIAIANAKRAYARYKALFSGPRWDALAASGAKTQRLLWASTSTKNKAYKDTLYAEALIGRDTVDTMPPATMDAFRDHGEARPDAIEQDFQCALDALRSLGALGISLDRITDELVEDGVRQFADAFDKLLGAVARRRRAQAEGEASIRFGSDELEEAYKAEMESWRRDGKIRRLWAGDKSLWSQTDEDRWLGWLRSVEQELASCSALEDFAQGVKAGGFTDVVLLGMGGSSLGPEVLAEVFGPQPGWPRLRILDSTDPAQIKALADGLDVTKTLFFVSSKSGGTLEPNIFMAYFFDRVATLMGEERAGAHFVAVTDPGSSLEQEAKRRHFWRVFHGAPSIGGRYSVLSEFGMAPAAAMGIDVRGLLESTQRMQRSCGPDAPPSENPGVELGVAMGVAARDFKRDKVTILASPRLASFGAWLEQLLAESTGKQGRGLIPLAGEPPAAPDHYGADRFFACLEIEGDADPELQGAVQQLERAGHPLARIKVREIADLGQEFFRWEMAVAVAGSIIGIDPFDQPDVEASKVKTRDLTDQYEKTHHFPEEEPMFRHNGVAVYADPRNAAELGRQNTLADYLKRHFERVHAGDYVALLPYVQRDAAHEKALTAMRALIRDRTHAATCVGFGPRFQHSTGQAYKGGPNSGVFLQITCDDAADLDVPGHAYSFGVVKAAQARGDLDELYARGRRALRIHVKNVDAGLAEIARAMEAALH